MHSQTFLSLPAPWLRPAAANIIWPELLDRFTDQKKHSQAIFAIDPKDGLIIQLSPPIKLDTSNEIKQIAVDDLLDVTEYKQINLSNLLLNQYRDYFKEICVKKNPLLVNVEKQAHIHNMGAHISQRYALSYYTLYGIGQNKLMRGKFNDKDWGSSPEDFQSNLRLALSSQLISAIALINPTSVPATLATSAVKEMAQQPGFDSDKKKDYFRVLQFEKTDSDQIGFSYTYSYFLKENGFLSWSDNVLGLGSKSSYRTIIMHANELTGLDIRAIADDKYKNENEILCPPKQSIILQPIAEVGSYTFVETRYACEEETLVRVQVDPGIINVAMRYMHENYFKQPYLLSTLGQQQRGKVGQLDRKSICDDDVVLRLSGKPLIYNYNHGPIHALRKVVMLPAVIQFFSEHAKPELKAFCHSLLTQREIVLDDEKIAVQTLLDEIGLVAAWISNGRDNEFSWDDNSQLYTRFRRQSFSRFKAFLDSNTSTIKIPAKRIAMYKDILDHLGNPGYMCTMRGFSAFVMHLVNTTQALDMPRTYSRETSVNILQDRLSPLLSEDGMKFIPDLLHYSLSLIATSGDRIFDHWTPDQWVKDKYPRFDSWVERIRLSARGHEPCFVDFSLPEGFIRCRRRLQALPTPMFKAYELNSQKINEIRKKIATQTLNRFFKDEQKNVSALKKGWFLLFANLPKITKDDPFFTLKAWSVSADIEKLSEQDIISIIDEYLKASPEIINMEDDTRKTALYYAAGSPNKNILLHLLNKGAIWKLDSLNSPLEAAIKAGYAENIRLLIKANVQISRGELYGALLFSHDPLRKLEMIYSIYTETITNEEIMKMYFSRLLYDAVFREEIDHLEILLNFRDSYGNKISLVMGKEIYGRKTALDAAVDLPELSAFRAPLLILAREDKERSAIVESALNTLILQISRYDFRHFQAVFSELCDIDPGVRYSIWHKENVDILLIKSIYAGCFSFIDLILARLEQVIDLNVLLVQAFTSMVEQVSFDTTVLNRFIHYYKLNPIDAIVEFIKRTPTADAQKIVLALCESALEMNDDHFIKSKESIKKILFSDIIKTYKCIYTTLIDRLVRCNMLTREELISLSSISSEKDKKADVDSNSAQAINTTGATFLPAPVPIASPLATLGILAAPAVLTATSLPVVHVSATSQSPGDSNGEADIVAALKK
jgi:hypothetical protein